MKVTSYAAELQVALDAARAAGRLLRRQFTRPREVTRKGWRDYVTDADVAAQAVIVQHIRARFPKHAILAEEGEHGLDLASARPTWIIDPLDGTSNYARQFPAFGVSIALAQRGVIRVGVIYDPLLREAYFAERGRGAFLQAGRATPRPLHVSGETDLARATIGTGWPRAVATRRRSMAATARLGAACHTLRANGSAALTLAYVAAGRLEGAFHLALQPWDVAAGALLVTEAGGRLSAPDGAAWRLELTQIVASNGALQTALIRALRLG